MAKYHEIMAADPESPEGLGGMIRCFVGMRDIAAARDIIDQLDEDFREKPVIQAAVAAVELAEKTAGAADGIDAARTAVDANPQDLQARQELALALFAIGEEANAMAQLLESIRIDRDWNETAARTQLLEFFKTLGPANQNVIRARRQLSTMLFS